MGGVGEAALRFWDTMVGAAAQGPSHDFNQERQRGCLHLPPQEYLTFLGERTRQTHHYSQITVGQRQGLADTARYLAITQCPLLSLKHSLTPKCGHVIKSVKCKPDCWDFRKAP